MRGTQIAIVMAMTESETIQTPTAPIRLYIAVGARRQMSTRMQ